MVAMASYSSAAEDEAGFFMDARLILNAGLPAINFLKKI